jgi:uncharacterized protein (TIGR02117 family)
MLGTRPFASLRLRRALRAVASLAARSLAALLFLTTLYIAFGYAVAFFPINRDFASAPDGIEIFVASSGVHTDIVLPVRAAGIDWTGLLPLSDLRDSGIAPSHVGFGWGDRDFYLETRRWSDLRPVTALRAVFGLGPSVLHVVWQGRPLEAENIRRVRINAMQLARIVRALRESFASDGGGRPIAIAQAAYGEHDAFYQAHGSYSLLVTCNEFIRKILAAAGIRTAIWAPFDFDVLHPLPAD